MDIWRCQIFKYYVQLFPKDNPHQIYSKVSSVTAHLVDSIGNVWTFDTIREGYVYNNATGKLTITTSEFKDAIALAEFAYNNPDEYDAWIVLEVNIEKYRSLDDLRSDGLTSDDLFHIATMQSAHTSILEYLYQYTIAQKTQMKLDEIAYTIKVTIASTLITLPISCGMSYLGPVGQAGSSLVSSPAGTIGLGALRVGVAVASEVMEELYVDPLIESYVSNMIKDMGGDTFWQIFGSTFAESFRETFFSMVTGVAKNNILNTQRQNQYVNTLHFIEQEGLLTTQESITQWESEQQQRQLRLEAIQLGISSLLMFAGILTGITSSGFYGPTIAASLITLGTVDIPLKELLDKIAKAEVKYLPTKLVSDVGRKVLHEELDPLLQERVRSLSDKPVATQQMIENTVNILPERSEMTRFMELAKMVLHSTESSIKLVHALGLRTPDTYSTIALIKDIRTELQTHSEVLAQIFPERVNRFSDRDLSRFWRGSNFRYISRVKNKITNPNNKDYRPEFRFLDTDTSLRLLEQKLSERLGAKALGCIRLIQEYNDPNSGISTLRFIKMLEHELGRVSGEIFVTNEELSLILAGNKDFIHRTLDTINNPQSKRWYNPDYKFTLERLDYFRKALQRILGSRALKLLEMINTYHLYNPNLQYWHEKDYSIKRENFFKDVNMITKAYWLGYLCADGSLERTRSRISFSQKVGDEKRVIRFCNALGLDTSRIRHSRRFWIYKGRLHSGIYVDIKFSSKLMVNDLENLGFLSFKSGDIGLLENIKSLILNAKAQERITGNPWFITYSGRVACAWLLGFYDGDGTYLTGNQGKIYSSNKKALDDIKLLFEIKNDIHPQLNLEKYLEEGLEIPDKPLYYLTLGPEIFQAMMNSYIFSMNRKRNLDINFNQRFLGEYS